MSKGVGVFKNRLAILGAGKKSGRSRFAELQDTCLCCHDADDPSVPGDATRDTIRAAAAAACSCVLRQVQSRHAQALQISEREDAALSGVPARILESRRSGSRASRAHHC